jgi:glutamine synthetase
VNYSERLFIVTSINRTAGIEVPANLSASKRAEPSIIQRLPLSLQDAVDANTKDRALNDTIGKSLIREFILVKTKELEVVN